MDVSSAMQNMVLTATDMGLVPCYLVANYESKVKMVSGILDHMGS
jgi:hypothetical protein